MGRWVTAASGYLCLSADLGFQRLVEKRQRIEISFDALGQMSRRFARDAPALGGEAEFLQHFGIQVDQDRFAIARDAVALRPFQIALVPVAHVLVGTRQLVMEHAIVLLIHLPLVRIGFAEQRLLAALAAPARQKADAGAGFGLPVDDEIGIVAVLALAFLGDEGGQFQARAQFDQHLLERLAFARRRQHRNAHRIHRAVELRNRPVQHRHHIMALQISRVRQDQIREGSRLGMESIANHDERNLVLAVLVPCR